MTKLIMLQGTASGVGKSTLAAALCRVLAQEGWRVAPFKSQNMSANAHLLPDGRRMARSQALAAYACGLEPHSDMNPLLLIPNGQGTEVILNGQSRGQMNHLDFAKAKGWIWEEILAAYSRLHQQYDLLVIEGAGSPVELNLNRDDLVNMGLATRLQSPVLLVSDISRGGVFASLYGTMQLFEPAQRQLVKGMVINQFCGDPSYFGEGRAILEQLCGVPLLGMLPHLELRLEDEDSLCSGAYKTRELLADGPYRGDTPDYRRRLDGEFDRLAEACRANLNLEAIKHILDAQ